MNHHHLRQRANPRESSPGLDALAASNRLPEMPHEFAQSMRPHQRRSAAL